MFDPAFNTVSEFLAMGHYAFYVWLAYGLTFLVMVGNSVFYFVKHKKVYQDLLRNQQRQLKQGQLKQTQLKQEHLKQEQLKL